MRDLARVARRQLSLFTLEQVLACGITRSGAARERAAGHWTEIEPHVYRHAAAGPISWQQRTMARVLATGGVACGRSAAALFGLLDAPGVPEVVVERSHRSLRHQRPGVRSIEVLEARDVTRIGGVPATTPALTLIMLGGLLDESLVRDLVDTAIVRRLVTPRRLAERATTLWAPRRKGCAMVLRLLSTAHPELWRARNRWEARVLRVLRQAGVPNPIPNHPVTVDGQRRVIDFAWPVEMVALEFDGFVPHATRRVFDDDRERQNLLVDAGWRIYRLTATAVTRQPQRSIAPVVRAVAVQSVAA
jgi:hypothetical protein